MTRWLIAGVLIVGYFAFLWLATLWLSFHGTPPEPTPWRASPPGRDPNEADWPEMTLEEAA